MDNQSELTINEDGIKFWRLNGLFHRDDGPAVEYPDGSKEWCVNGKLHRTDGPALEYFDGGEFWFIKGYGYDTKEEWFQALTPEQQYNYLWNLDE
jgi:hypothetical protein